MKRLPSRSTPARRHSAIECLEQRIAPALVFGVQTPPLLGQNLIAFDSDAPGTLLLNKAITGLNADETIEAMDFRPSDGVLFAATNEERIVTLDTTTGAATLVGSFTLPVSTPPGGTQVFDIDFDPVSGNIRALSDWDQNFLIDPATGAVIPNANNGDFIGYAGGDPNAGKSPFFVTAAGFTNNVPGATNATLFGIDTSVNGGAGVLVRVGNVNAEGDSKVLNTVGSLNLGGDTINSGYQSGFDISSVGTAFAALNTTNFGSSFYTIDLTTGAATRVGNISAGNVVTDDIAVSPAAFYISSPSVTEGDSGTKTLTFTVTLSEALGSTASVNYSTANGTATTGNNDYVAKSGTLTFAAGVRTQTIDVTINGDAANEGNETFFVNLSNVVNASLAIRQGTGTIQNDDGAPTISINDRPENEEATGATTNAAFDITLSAPSSQTITVDYATANGTTAGHIAQTSDNDYTATSGTVTFAPGETLKTIFVPVKGDTTPENNEYYFVNLSNPTNATIADGQGLGTILNDDLVFSIGNAPAAAEGNSGTRNATFTVTLTGENNLPVQVSYATQDGTATTAFGSDPDYVTKSGVVVFAPATHSTELFSTQTIDVQVNGDLVGEPDETFTVVLSTPTAGAIIGAGQGTGSHTITNDDVPFVPITDFDPSSPAFNGGVFVATGDVNGDGHPDIITGADAGGQTRVKVFSGNGGAQLFSFLAGDSSNTTGVRVAAGDVNGDGKADIITTFGPGGPHDVKVFSGADGSLIRTFFPFPGLFAPDGLFVAAGDVNLDGKADIILGSDAGSRPTVLVINGDTGAQLKLFYPFATDFTGGVRVAAGRVNVDQNADFIVSTGPGSAPLVKVYDGSPSGEVLMSFAPYDAAFTGGVFVGAGDVNGDGRADIITGPGAGGTRPVEVFSGVNGGIIDAITPYEANYTGGIHVAGGLITQDSFAEIVTGSGTGRAPLVKIFDRHTIPPGAQLFIGNATIDEGTDIARSITLQVAINAPHASTVTVDFTTGDGSATAGFDFTTTSGTLSFAPGEFVKTITVPIVTDGNAEPDEIFTVNLSNASGAAIFNGTGIATLKNDDLPARSLILAQSYLGSGVSIAAGDINGDGVSDTVIGPATGAAPLVSVYTRPDSPAFNAFFAYDSSFKGGLSVAIGDVNGDGTGDVIVGPGLVGVGRNVIVDPLPVKVFDGTTLGNPSPTVLMSLFPFGQNPDSVFLGISVAAGDVDGDGKADIIVARNDRFAAVKVFSGADAHEMRNFGEDDLDRGTIQTFPIPDNPRTEDENESEPAETLPYRLSGFTLEVAAGDVNGDGKADIIVGFGVDEPSGDSDRRINPATANPKTVNVFSGATSDANAFTLLSSFLAFRDSEGVAPSVAAGDLDGDGKSEVVVGSPAIAGAPQVKFFNGLTGVQIAPGQLGQPALSERAAPAPDPNALVVYDVKFRGGVNVALADMTGDGIPDLITAPGPSKARGVAEIKFLDVASPLSRSFFDPSTLPTTGLGTVRVAMGDVTGDGIADIVRTGTKTATVSVFDGATGALLRTLAPFGGKVKGAYVAVGDTNFDGIGDIVVGSPKKPQVQIYSGVDGALLQDFTPGDPKEFKGGVSVASADYNGDGRADVLIGSLTKPHFLLVRGNTPTEQILLRGDAGLKGGIHVAMANVDGIGAPELIFSAVKWTKGLPRLEVRDSGGVFDVGGTAFQFSPFGETYRGRISLAAGDVNGDGKADIIVATGRGPASEVKVISGATGGIIGDYFPFGATNKLGTAIAAGDLNGDGSADLLGITTIARLVTTKIIPGAAA